MRNYYIERDENKDIIGLFARPQYEGQERLSGINKEIVSFLKKQNDANKLAEETSLKIAKEMRLLAINSLKAKKELPVDFKD